MKTRAWLLILLAGVAQAENGTLLRAAELKQKPFLDAGKVADLAAQSPLEIVARQGAWMQVKVGGQTGWVKMLNVRTGSGETKGGGGGILSAVNIFKTGSSGTTVTTGVKGLSEEDIKNAQPNKEQLAKLGTYAATPDEAEKFAKAGKLASNKQIDYLPKPSGSDSNR